MSSFTLKLIAVMGMILDHLAYFFPEIFPVSFHWIGRISFPIFIFCLTQGLQYTSSRKKYIVRLYVFSLIMGFGNLVLNKVLLNTETPLIGNIFTTLCIIGTIITLFEAKIKQYKKILLGILFIAVQFVSLYIGMSVIGEMSFTNIVEQYSYMTLLGSVTLNVFLCEGEVFYILLGLIVYTARKSRIKVSVVIGIFSIFAFTSALLHVDRLTEVFTLQYEWMMIFAVPLLMHYNETIGKKVKYFFYTFYPLHMWGLYIIAGIFR